MRRGRHHNLPKRQTQNASCVLCPEVPPCACASGELCVSVERTCNTCGSNICLPGVPSATPTSSSSAVSIGAVAGAVTASALILVAVVLTALWIIRRQWRSHPKTVFEKTVDVPAPAEEVLKRPDPIEQVAVPGSPDMPTFRTYDDGGGSMSDLHSSSYLSSHAATHGHTHGLPGSLTGADIGHSQPNLISAFAPSIQLAEPSAYTPIDHAPVSPALSPNPHSTFVFPSEKNRAGSRLADHTRLGVRDSYNTTTTFSSEFSDVGVAPTRGTVKQVLGVARAEVIRTPKPSLSSVHPSVFNRLSGTLSTLGWRRTSSPLPPVPSHPEGREAGFGEGDPFRDRQTPSPSSPTPRSPAPTSATFGDTGSPLRKSWALKGINSRPVSTGTNPGSVHSAASSHGRPGVAPPLTSSRPLLAPPSSDVPQSPITAPLSPPGSSNVPFPASSPRPTLTVPTHGVLQQQQQRALDRIAAGPPRSSRVSVISAISATSSLAESILSAFPFVPPSPVSIASAGSGSLRVPPRSPLAQLSFSGSSDAAAKRESNTSSTSASASASGLLATPASTDRGPSPASTASKASGAAAPPAQRASLDTVALTNDLKQYPLFLNRKVKRASQG